LVLESERQRQRRDKVVSRRLWPWNVTRHR
jgi:hypothetical protein